MKEHILKVHKRVRKKTGRNSLTIFPEIRLSGVWLKDAGIIPGRMVTVSIINNHIIIHQ
jgi:cell division inhibitor SulA